MRPFLVATAGTSSIFLALAGFNWLAVAIVLTLTAYALLPERCIDGHRLRTYEARDWIGHWYWVPWRCVRCGRLTGDVEPDWRQS